MVGIVAMARNRIAIIVFRSALVSSKRVFSQPNYLNVKGVM